MHEDEELKCKCKCCGGHMLGDSCSVRRIPSRPRAKCWIVWKSFARIVLGKERRRFVDGLSEVAGPQATV